MKIIMIGPQGCGKGTQAALLSEKLDIAHISTGDIFRKNIKEMTELGKRASGFIRSGELVPDELTNELVRDTLEKEDDFILDGYPRNLAQAEFLDSFCTIDHAIEIGISDEEAVRRISGRRTCKECGAVASVFTENYSSRCPKCGGELIIRVDDKEESVRKRLEIYHNETEPLVKHYKAKGKLLRIDGERPISTIFDDIQKKIR